MMCGTMTPAPRWCCSTRWTRHGKMVPAAAEAGKVGNVFIVNRLTGKLIRKSDPISTIGANFMKPPTETPMLYMPANKGGAMWSPPAYSPLTHDFYTMGVNEAHVFVVRPVKGIYIPDTPITGQYAGGSMATELNAYHPNGTFSAVDTETGKIAWQYQVAAADVWRRAGHRQQSGFHRRDDGRFRRFRRAHGQELWRYNMGAGVCTPPITYRIKGVQYVAVGAGGCHGGEALMQDEGRPIFGDVFAIFALPEKI